jgi:hypothetical protein
LCQHQGNDDENKQYIKYFVDRTWRIRCFFDSPPDKKVNRKCKLENTCKFKDVLKLLQKATKISRLTMPELQHPVRLFAPVTL